MESHTHSKLTDILFWLTAPLAACALMIFGLYFWGRRSFGHTPLQYPWALTVGLAMVLTNVGYNVFVASLVFRRLPPWTNTRGELSPFFTTRLKLYWRQGMEPGIVPYLMSSINSFDPNHFNAASDLG